MLGWLDDFRAPAPTVRRIGWLGEHVYAHRGLHGPGAIENSALAFGNAVKAGMGIECDVQLTRDRKAAVFHDWDLDRLTGESGPVAQRKLDDLRTIQLTGSDGRIGGLQDLLAQVQGRVPLLIEVKSRRDHKTRSLCLAVRRALEGYGGKFAVMSFDPQVPAWFARNAPTIVRGLVVTEENDGGLLGRLGRHRDLWRAQPDFLAYDVRDLPSRFAAAQRARGLPVLTWTVRSPELASVAADHADAPIAEGEGLADQSRG